MSETESEEEMERHDRAGQRGEEPPRFERRRVKPEDMKPDAALAALATQQEVSVQRITLEERGRRRLANEVRAHQDRASDNFVENQARTLHTDIEEEPRDRN